MDLNNRVALITGSAKRVGKAIALRLAQSGCNVAIHYQSSKDAADVTVNECRTFGVKAEMFEADLAETDQAASLVKNVIGTFGKLDVLINNASVFDTMTLDEFDISRWNATLAVNLSAPMILAHAAKEALRSTKGRIINLLDVSTQRPWPDHLAYITSKGGLETLTLALARAFAPDVNVVGIAPGVAAWPETYDEDTRQKLIKRIPLKRTGTPDDIATAAHYLLKDGDYITGTVLPVDGGRHIV